jgi:hypothetical protein
MSSAWAVPVTAALPAVMMMREEVVGGGEKRPSVFLTPLAWKFSETFVLRVL